MRERSNGKHAAPAPDESNPGAPHGTQSPPTAAPVKTDQGESPSINDTLAEFLHSIDALNGALPFLMLMMKAGKDAAGLKLNRFLSSKCTTDDADKPIGSRTYQIPEEHSREFRWRKADIDKAATAEDIVPEVFLMALVSQFDAFLGKLLRCLYLKKPALLHGSTKQMTYAEVVGFGTIGEAKDYILEKEIEDVIRESHSEHFAWMERKFDVKLRVDLPAWPIYIELTERRNLYAHCNGYVSRQYLAVCNEHKALDSLPALGTHLAVDDVYMRRAHGCLYEIATKLTHVLWRKLLPNEREKADWSLCQGLFELIAEEQYALAIILGIFATETLHKWSNEQVRLYMKINLAQAYKWKGMKEKCDEIVSKEDWTSREAPIKLAVALLRDDFAEAIALMKKIGRNGDVKDKDYKDWPLFRELRKRPDFLATYAEIFDKPFAPIEQIVTRPSREWSDLRVEYLYESEAALRDGQPADWVI